MANFVALEEAQEKACGTARPGAEREEIVIERDGKAAAELVLVPAVEEPAEKKDWRIGGQTLWALRMSTRIGTPR
jgi:hypothetical protein